MSTVELLDFLNQWQSSRFEVGSVEFYLVKFRYMGKVTMFFVFVIVLSAMAFRFTSSDLNKICEECEEDKGFFDEVMKAVDLTTSFYSVEVGDFLVGDVDNSFETCIILIFMATIFTTLGWLCIQIREISQPSVPENGPSEDLIPNMSNVSLRESTSNIRRKLSNTAYYGEQNFKKLDLNELCSVLRKLNIFLDKKRIEIEDILKSAAEPHQTLETRIFVPSLRNSEIYPANSLINPRSSLNRNKYPSQIPKHMPIRESGQYRMIMNGRRQELMRVLDLHEMNAKVSEKPISANKKTSQPSVFQSLNDKKKILKSLRGVSALTKTSLFRFLETEQLKRSRSIKR